MFQKKIDKRGRKLIDFDAERHAVQQMQNNPNRNEAKFIKAKEQMENAKRTYEVLNSELHDELPALHDSRILFLVTNMQTLFAAEEVFHSETAKVSRTMWSVKCLVKFSRTCICSKKGKGKGWEWVEHFYDYFVCIYILRA